MYWNAIKVFTYPLECLSYVFWWFSGDLSVILGWERSGWFHVIKEEKIGNLGSTGSDENHVQFELRWFSFPQINFSNNWGIWGGNWGLMTRVGVFRKHKHFISLFVTIRLEHVMSRVIICTKSLPVKSPSGTFPDPKPLVRMIALIDTITGCSRKGPRYHLTVEYLWRLLCLLRLDPVSLESVCRKSQAQSSKRSQQSVRSRPWYRTARWEKQQPGKDERDA